MDLREGLRPLCDHSPPVPALEELRARARQRRFHRQFIQLVSVGGVLAVLFGIIVITKPGPAPRVATSRTSVLVPTGWKAVPFNGVQFAVPAAWPIHDDGRCPDLGVNAVYLGLPRAQSCSSTASALTVHVYKSSVDTSGPDFTARNINGVPVFERSPSPNAPPNAPSAFTVVIPSAGTLLDIEVISPSDRSLAAQIIDTIAPYVAPGSSSGHTASTSRADPEPGDPASWTTDPAAPPTPDSSTFSALVTRLACNGGVTGRILRPGIVVTPTEIVVTFNAEALPTLGPNEGRTCPGNNAVRHEVQLDQPIGAHALVDGNCQPGKKAATTAFCDTDGGVRWKPHS